MKNQKLKLDLRTPVAGKHQTHQTLRGNVQSNRLNRQQQPLPEKFGTRRRFPDKTAVLIHAEQQFVEANRRGPTSSLGCGPDHHVKRPGNEQTAQCGDHKHLENRSGGNERTRLNHEVC